MDCFLKGKPSSNEGWPLPFPPAIVLHSVPILKHAQCLSHNLCATMTCMNVATIFFDVGVVKLRILLTIYVVILSNASVLCVFQMVSALAAQPSVSSPALLSKMHPSAPTSGAPNFSPYATHHSTNPSAAIGFPPAYGDAHPYQQPTQSYPSASHNSMTSMPVISDFRGFVAPPINRTDHAGGDSDIWRTPN